MAGIALTSSGVCKLVAVPSRLGATGSVEGALLRTEGLPDPFPEAPRESRPGPIRRWWNGVRTRWRIPKWGCILLILTALIATTARLCSRREGSAGPSSSATLAPAPTIVGPTSVAMATATTIPTEMPREQPTESASPRRLLEGWTQFASLPAPAPRPDGLAFDGATLWVRTSNGIYSVGDEGTHLSEAGRAGCRGLWAWDGEQVWLVREGRAFTCDPASGAETPRLEVPLADPRAIAVQEGELWAIDAQANLVAYNQKGRQTAEITAPIGAGAPVAMAWVEQELWIATADAVVVRLDGQSFQQLGSLNLAEACGVTETASELALTWDGDILWIADTVGDWMVLCTPEG